MMILKASILASIFALTEASVDYITDYRPVTSVTDQNALDLDQKVINDLMGRPNQDNFEKARKVYEYGGHSKTIATLYLNVTELADIPLNLPVNGLAVDGSQVSGKVYEKPKQTGDRVFEMKVQYDTSKVQSDYMNCKVGGLDVPITNGCFAATGSLNVGNIYATMDYSYDPTTDNKNDRTIKSLSTSAEEQMKPSYSSTEVTVGDDGFFVHFQKFVDYYGTPFYGDDFVTSALNGLKTDFTNGNVDFRNELFAPRSQSVKKGTSYMIIAMYAIRQMEDAVVECIRGLEKDEETNDPGYALDQAVAYYTGSLEGTSMAKSSNGVLMYNLADKRCTNFKTCGEEADLDSTVSNVNRRVFKLFKSMQQDLVTSDCMEVKKKKDEIVALMTIPLIQGTLKYAYYKEFNVATVEDALEGNVFAQSVLPYIYACNEDAAKTILENMDARKTDADYKAVKLAFESVYSCLKITCQDVGGQWDGTAYKEGGEPCTSDAHGIGSFGLVVLGVSFILSVTM